MYAEECVTDKQNTGSLVHDSFWCKWYDIIVQGVMKLVVLGHTISTKTQGSDSNSDLCEGKKETHSFTDTYHF